MKYLNCLFVLLTLSCSGNDFDSKESMEPEDSPDSGTAPVDTVKVPPEPSSPPVNTSKVPPEPPPPVDDSEKGLIETLNKLASVEAKDAKPVGELLFLDDGSIRSKVSAKPGHCYTVLAVGSSEVVDVELKLVIASLGLLLATDSTLGSSAVLSCYKWTPAYSGHVGDVDMVAILSRGYGLVAIQVFEERLP